MVERLDEERLETLRAWGAGLSTNARDELRAAGKAILMLVDEIDRLEADLWNARAATKQAEGEAAAAKEVKQWGRRRHGRRRACAGRPGRGAGAHGDACRRREPASTTRAPRERRSPTVEPSQVLALTLSERIARGRPPSSETA